MFSPCADFDPLVAYDIVQEGIHHRKELPPIRKRISYIDKTLQQLAVDVLSTFMFRPTLKDLTQSLAASSATNTIAYVEVGFHLILLLFNKSSARNLFFAAFSIASRVI